MQLFLEATIDSLAGNSVSGLTQHHLDLRYQNDFNIEHNIIPKTISKEITYSDKAEFSKGKRACFRAYTDKLIGTTMCKDIQSKEN